MFVLNVQLPKQRKKVAQVTDKNKASQDDHGIFHPPSYDNSQSGHETSSAENAPYSILVLKSMLQQCRKNIITDFIGMKS